MKADNSKQIIKHIFKYTNDINNLIDRFGNDYDIFEEDIAYNSACSFAVFQIGELTVKLSDEFKQKHDEIPWHKMRGVRNIIAHQYGSVDMEIMWEIMMDSIPELKSFAEKILNQV